MVLGIKLEIDKKSIRDASKALRGGTGRGARGAGGRLGVGTAAGAVVGAGVGSEAEAGEKKKGKGDKKGGTPFGGALVGGLIGAIVGSLKPIQELLGVVAGILQIFMVPVLVLLKPFLILFLKVGIALMKAFTPGAGETGAEGVKRKGGIISGLLVGAFVAIVAALAGAPALIIGAIALAAFFLGKALFDFGWWLGGKLVQFFTWIFDAVILPVWQWLADKFRQIGVALAAAWQWVINVAKTIWSWFKRGFEAVLRFGSRVWDLFKEGLSSIANFGTMIWDLFKEGLKGIANLGTKIWNWIKSSIGSLFGFGGGSTSVDDALITSQGQVIKLNPNDNILAFQDFNQVSNVAGAGAGGSNIHVTVNGFVGNDQEIAERLAKALNKSSRGGIIQF